VDADPPYIRGRPKRDRDATDPPVPIHRGNGDSMSGRYLGQRGRPVPDAGSQPVTILIVYWSGRESERVIIPVMPGNAGGGKGPYFWRAFEGDEKR